MIIFNGYEELIKSVYRFNQEHVFEYWDSLNHEEKKELLFELSSVNFELMNKLYQEIEKDKSLKFEFDPAPYIALPNSTKDMEKYEEARKIGIEYIKRGKTAALLVAGGQGTRLGFDGPKGMYPVGPISNKSLFQIHGSII